MDEVFGEGLLKNVKDCGIVIKAGHPDKVLCSAVYVFVESRFPHQPRNVDLGFVIAGRRHSNCFVSLSFLKKNGLYVGCDVVQGFITKYNYFVPRKFAREIAKFAGQVRQDSMGDLYSEDLY